MLQVAQYSCSIPSPSELTDADLDRIRQTVERRLQAFYRMQSEIDEFMNPFAEWTQQSPPLFICYILWCIDELSMAEAEAMEVRSSVLQREYNQTGTWQEIVSAVMGVNPRWNSRVRRMWQQNLYAGEDQKMSPIEFAKHLIDQNVHLR